MNKFDPTDPIVKEAIDFVCEAIELNPLFLETLLMDPVDDKDDIFQCTAKLIEKHDYEFVLKFIAAVVDSGFENAFNKWDNLNTLNRKESKATFLQMWNELRKTF